MRTDITTLTSHDIRAIAVAACVDPRSVKARLEGRSTRPMIAQRIDKAIADLGHKPGAPPGQDSIDESALFVRAERAYRAQSTKKGSIHQAPSQPGSGFSTFKGRKVYELRNLGGVLARFEYDAAKDRLRMIVDGEAR